MTGAAATRAMPSAGYHVKNPDDNKKSRRLLDTFAVVDAAARALEDISTKYDDDLPEKCAADLQLVADVLQQVHKAGRQQTAALSPVPYLLSCYDKSTAAQRKVDAKRGVHPGKYHGSESLWQVKRYGRDTGGGTTPAAPDRDGENAVETPRAAKKPRRSERIVTPEGNESFGEPPNESGKWTKTTLFTAITKLRGTGRTKEFVEKVLEAGPLVMGGVEYRTPKSIYTLYEKKGFSGKPLNGEERWTKLGLIAALSDIERENVLSMRAFIERVVEVGKTDYKHRSGISKMYKAWKDDGGQTAPKDVGRPALVDIGELSAAATKALGTTDSSAVKLKDVRSIYAARIREKAAANGLDPESVNVEVCDKMVKEAIIIATMPEDSPQLTRKKMLRKTSTRYTAENSVRAAMAYALTALSTHFCVGPRPSRLAKQIGRRKLTKEVKQTLEMMKKALGTDQIHPVDPNLVISTDDTTLFVFEGAKEGGEWQWKIADRSNGDSSVRSDFEVKDDAENSGGLRVRITVSMTASGLMAPLYVAVSGLTSEELSPALCPDGIIAEKVDNLCVGGNGVFDSGFGWLTFLRADKKASDGKPAVSIGEKKFIHYNKEVLIPFIQNLREQLGWSKGDPVPEWLKAVCWFDGDIPQLKAMLYDAAEALDEAERIIRNKHSAAATGTQQPCDLSPVFRLLKEVASRATSKDSTAVGLRDKVEELFAVTLRAQGLNLDGNVRKKKALIDFLISLPDIAQEVFKARHLMKGFVEAGLIDEESGWFPTFEALMRTCKRWGSASANTGLLKTEMDNCREQFQSLMKIQLDNSRVTPADMEAAELPRDFAPNGEEIEREKPSGASAEHQQYAFTVSGAEPKRLREERRRQKALKAHGDATSEYNGVNDILQRNIDVEQRLKEMTATGSLEDATIADCMKLTGQDLTDFIHCRTFNKKTFSKAHFFEKGAEVKLNKTLYKGQTAEQIESECGLHNPCLVWLAWNLRSSDLVLKVRSMPVMDISVPAPSFDIVTSAPPVAAKKPSDYLRDEAWVSAFESTVKGINPTELDDAKIANADDLHSNLRQRLPAHISGKVDTSKQDHWTLRFVRDNLATTCAGMCLAGHVLPDVKDCNLIERLLQLPIDAGFEKIFGDGVYSEALGRLEGAYLHYETAKHKWPRSGKSAGDGATSNFRGRNNTHLKNARSKTQQRDNRAYRTHPDDRWARLDMYCAMAFDKTGNVEALLSVDAEDSLFVWSDETIDELKKRGDLKKLQLDAVSYLWELCYDLMLATSDNLSDSPGFEALGLRVNGKRKRDDE